MADSTDAFRAYAEKKIPLIDAALEAALASLPPGCPSLLRDAMRYSLLAPGKRIRPLLALMAAEACGAETDAAMPAACAVEMVHAYSLIHDDLPAMDDDDLRRGRPTSHKVFGEGQAILAGDGLLTLAFETLAKGMRPAEKALACVRILAEAAGPIGMVGGQSDDLAMEHADAVALDTLLSIHGRKTGALIEAALLMGGTVAGADPPRMDALRTYGRKLGLLFQITDDLLDVTGSAEAAGKRVGKDAGRGKTTFPGLLGVEEARRRVQALRDEIVELAKTMGDRGFAMQSLAHVLLDRQA